MPKPATWPPPAPKPPTRPLPQARVVTGANHTGIHGLPSCKGHGYFLLTSPPRKVKDSNSGYQQDCECVSCTTQYKNVDCEFLMIPVSKEQALAMARRCTQARNQLLHARQIYRQIAEMTKS